MSSSAPPAVPARLALDGPPPPGPARTLPADPTGFASPPWARLRQEVPARFALQQAAHYNRRRHFLQEVSRITVLMAADLAVLAGLVALLVPGRGLPIAQPLADELVALWDLAAGARHDLEIALLVLVALFLCRCYRPGERRRNPTTIVAASGLSVAMMGWTRIWHVGSPRPVIAAIVMAVVLALALLAGRLVVDRVVRWLRPGEAEARRVLAVGTAADVSRARAQLPFSDEALFQCVGFVSPGAEPHPEALGVVDDLPWVLAHHRVDTVLLCGRFDDAPFGSLVAEANAAGCEVVGGSRAVAAQGVDPRVMWRRGVPVVHLTRPALRGGQLVLKRAFDLAVAVTALVLASPILAAVALAVRLSSPGPIVFRQKRIGYGGRVFDILKFRSMVQDAEARRAEVLQRNVYGDARLFKIRDDPRITRVGRIIRKTSLDELPQLWNVVRADMSLVGPRPPLPSEVTLYEEHHYARFDMKPGITGPWQVSGRNRIENFDDVIRIETDYLRGWSLWRDVKILLKTIPAVLHMDGAH